MTTDAGLKVSSYGSYYRVGEEKKGSFAAVLDTARELHAPIIRVWAGKHGSVKTDKKYRNKIIRESRRIADMADAAGIIISYEFHGGTLADTNISARMLLEEVNHDKIKIYWQPIVGSKANYCLAGLKSLIPWVTNIHTFHWGQSGERRPLIEGQDAWKRYLSVIAASNRDHFLLLEFVKDDAPEMFLQDATTLKTWLEPYESGILSSTGIFTPKS